MNKRGDRGVIELEFIAIMLVIFVPMFVIAKKVDDMRSKNRARISAAALPTQARSNARPAVFDEVGGPPTENPECVKKVLKDLELTTLQSNGNWIDTKDPAPPEDSFSAVKDWKERMRRKVGSVLGMANNRNCNKAPASSEAPPANPGTTDLFPELLGTYNLSPTVTPTPECRTVLPKALQVVKFQSGTEFEMVLTASGPDSIVGGSYVAPFSNYTFRLTITEKYFAIQGTFITQESESIIEGLFSYSVGGGCGIDFVGKKAARPR